MFRKMRRYKQQIPEDECINLLKREKRGVLAVLGDDDYPYTVAMNHVYLDGKLYFHCAREGHKIDAIEKCDKVSYCVMDEGVKIDDNWWYTFKNVVVFGRMSKVTDDKLIETVLYRLGDTFNVTEEFMDEEMKLFRDSVLILELDIEHISGKIVNEK
ncbi:MAG: pyridoxamine 5'-phosphate oxidase family protein [Methanosphaera stadtmanae]|jgi:hypothetical protein|nr:pyridoxamine 5'-phosphate oxidase family protein [Methanosphaera stadtmanae]